MDRTSRRNHQIEAVLRAFPNLSFVIDRHGRYVEVIGGIDEQQHRDGRDLTGYTMHEVLPAELADHFLEVVRHALASGGLQRIEYTLSARELQTLGSEQHGDPRPRAAQWFEGRVLPLPDYDNDEPVVLWLAFNITERKELEEELRHLASTDDLTGLSNRRSAVHRLQRICQRTCRDGRPLALLLLDVDHFKRVNDTYGHAAGDRVLTWVAHQIQAVVRPGDVVSRLGGDEFLVGMPEADLTAAEEIAARLIECIRRSPIAYEGSVIRVTVSAGVTATAPHEEELEGLMRRADDGLYAAKINGRDGHARISPVHAEALLRATGQPHG